jgi:hypothetical protein
MVKKNRGGGNIPNIFMGIKTCITNIFEALGSCFICFVDVVAIIESLQPFNFSFVINMVDNFFIANNFKALDMSYFILHVGNIASLEACMFLVFLLLSMGFPLLKVIRARFWGAWGGGGRGALPIQGFLATKKNGE